MNITILTSILIGVILGAFAARELLRRKQARWKDATGVICAMDEESERFLADMKLQETRVVSGAEYRYGTLCGKRIVVVRCGMGKVNAAVTTQTMCREFGVKRLINVGVAGGADPTLHAGDVVVSEDAVQHDYHTIGCEPGRVLYQNTTFFPADERLREAALSVRGDASLDGLCIVPGRVATGDIFVDSDEMRNAIRTMFGAAVVEMEGAAMAQAASDNHVPWLILRAVADNANSESSKTMQQNLNATTESLYRLVCAMLPKLD